MEINTGCQPSTSWYQPSSLPGVQLHWFSNPSTAGPHFPEADPPDHAGFQIFISSPSLVFTPLCLWVGVVEGLGSQRITALPLYHFQCGLFLYVKNICSARLQVILRVCWIRYSCFLSVDMEGGYHSDLLFHHIPRILV